MKQRIVQVVEKYEGSERGNITSFAKKVGCVPQLVQKWVKGVSLPGADYRRRICEEYGISRDWLDTGEGEMYATPHVKATETAVGGKSGNALEYMLQVERLKGALEESEKLFDRFSGRIESVLTACYAKLYEPPVTRKAHGVGSEAVRRSGPSKNEANKLQLVHTEKDSKSKT